jgi:hypothetical protein
MKTIKIEAENEDPETPNEWRLRIQIDDQQPITELVHSAPWNLPQQISSKLSNLLSKLTSS